MFKKVQKDGVKHFGAPLNSQEVPECELMGHFAADLGVTCPECLGGKILALQEALDAALNEIRVLKNS